jgi:hypothetical protein
VKALFPNPVLYALLATSILTNVILIQRFVPMNWHRFVHRDQAVPAISAQDHIRGPVTAPIALIE